MPCFWRIVINFNKKKKLKGLFLHFSGGQKKELNFRKQFSGSVVSNEMNGYVTMNSFTAKSLEPKLQKKFS